MYLRADPSIKLEALEAVTAPRLRSGRFRATDELIASLTSPPFMRRLMSTDLDFTSAQEHSNPWI